MSETLGFNAILWELQNGMGWWFWLPFAGYGTVGLVLMYRLPPAPTALARTIRTVLTISFVSMVFVFQFNGLGSFAFHLVTIGMVLTVYQRFVDSKKTGLIKPPQSDTVLGRAVEKMLDRGVK